MSYLRIRDLVNVLGQVLAEFTGELFLVWLLFSCQILGKRLLVGVTAFEIDDFYDFGRFRLLRLDDRLQGC